ncbi:phosphatase PAP2 family protein [Rhizobium sp. BK376]|jgi:membrane-associated phospholipid phosphatase|uniref:phosphatase PAP2 family protein n=1 Tax=Rhizobium sp. BK376 TaxID=2512149 RepID=UPI0010449A3D|nr:phosphatase PAP2 family protein [Rhizobium sp. BK376]TCR91567.1 PAP2 superfamily protein [Rhizobium sp. BK376]
MSELERSRYLLWSLVALAYAIAFPLAWSVGMRIDYDDFTGKLLATLGFLAIVGGWCGYRRMLRLRVMVETICAGLLLSLPGMMFVYLSMRLDMPLADHFLAAIDRGLGVDWPSMIGFVDRHALLARILMLAYTSFSFQLLTVPYLLSIFGRTTRAYRMVFAYGAMIFISAVFASAFPAFGTVATYPLDASKLQNLNPYFWSDFVPQLHAIREDPNFIFRLTETKGILTFPSGHAAVAAICAWAMWDLKPLRYPALLLNVLMAVSAFTIANHYVIDVFAGFGVAAICIGLACFLTKARSAKSLPAEAAMTVQGVGYPTPPANP